MKNWFDANEVFKRNTEAEVVDELYGNGITAQYTRRIAELNAILSLKKTKRENEEDERAKV